MKKNLGIIDNSKKEQVQTNNQNNEASISIPSQTDDELKQMLMELLKKNQELQEQINSIKNNSQESTIVNDQDFQNVNEELDIDPKSLVKIVSLTNGVLNLKTNSVRPLRLNDYGSTRSITFEDLRTIVDYNQRSTREGKFYIQNSNAVKALYLEDEYKKIVDRKVIDTLMDRTNNEISSILNNITQSLRQTVAELIIKGLNDQNPKYNDRNKILHIGGILKIDLFKYAEEKTK